MADDKTYRLYHPGQTPVYAKHSGYFPNGKPSVKWVDNPFEASEFTKKEAQQIARRSEGIKPIVDRHPNSYPSHVRAMERINRTHPRPAPAAPPPARATAPIAPVAAGVPAKTKTTAAPLKAKLNEHALSSDGRMFLDEGLGRRGYKPGTALRDVSGGDLPKIRAHLKETQAEIVEASKQRNFRGFAMEKGKADPNVTQAMRVLDSEIAREKAFIKKQGDLFNPERAPNAPKPGVVKAPKSAARVTAAVSRTMLNVSPAPKPQAAPLKAPGKTLAGVALSAAMAALSGMTAKPAEASSGADRTKPYTYVRDGRTVEVVNGRLITRK